MNGADIGEKNLQYFTVERRMLVMSLWAGFFLWALFFAGLAGINGPVFDLVWIAHLVAHVITLGCAVHLLVMFVRTVAPIDLVLLIFGGGACLVFIAGFAILPIISRDALIYHLAVPKLWIEAGRIIEIPWHEWSHFPLLLSLGYTGFVKQGLEQLTPLYHGSYLVLSCGVLAAFVYYKFQDEYLALLSAFIALSMPICLKLGAEPMSDLGLAYFFGTAYALFIFWGEQRGSVRQLAAVGVFLGFALCTKYNSILAAMMFALCMISFLQRWGFSLSESAKSLGLLFGIALLLFLPWPVKNFIATGNPLYPFAGSIFGVSDELPFMGSVQPLEYRRLGYGESWSDIALIPLRMMFTGKDDSAQQFDGLLTPLLLFSVLPLLVKARGERRLPWVLNSWLLVVGYFAVSLTMFYALLRYQSPLLAPMIALTAHGIFILSAFVPKYSRVVTYRLVFALQLAWAAVYAVHMTKAAEPMGIWFGEETREAYLKRRLSEYDTALFVNASLPQDARIYLLFTGNRYFYYDRDVRGSYFSQTPIVQWLSENADAAHLAAKFHEAGYTHLAIHSRRTWESLNTSLDEAQKTAWTEFAKRYLELMYQDGPQTVWKLRQDPAPS